MTTANFTNRLTTPRTKPTLYTETITVQKIAIRSSEFRLAHSKRMSKYSDQQIREIRKLRLEGMTLWDLSLKFKASIPTICNILNGRTYSWVD